MSTVIESAAPPALSPQQTHEPIARLRAFAARASFGTTLAGMAHFDAVAHILPPRTEVAVAMRPGDDPAALVAAARRIRAAGLTPVPNVAARQMADLGAFLGLVARLVGEARATSLIVTSGNTATPQGEFAGALELLARGHVERLGVRRIGVAGYPESDTPRTTDAHLDTLIAVIADEGMEPFVTTQFTFDAAPVLDWLRRFRGRGHAADVRIGMAGPAGLRTLQARARSCGIGPSSRALVARGASIAAALDQVAPDAVVQELLADRAIATLGPITPHLFAFGGLARTARWADAVARGALRFHSYQSGFATT